MKSSIFNNPLASYFLPVTLLAVYLNETLGLIALSIQLILMFTQLYLGYKEFKK